MATCLAKWRGWGERSSNWKHLPYSIHSDLGSGLMPSARCLLAVWDSKSIAGASHENGSASWILRRKLVCRDRANRRAEFPKSLANATKTGDSEHTSRFPLDWDPFEDLFGLGVDLRARKDASSKREPSAKQGQDGLKEKPCPTCGGRGYLFCPDCNSTAMESSCPQCSGRGYFNCPLCRGERMVWEETSFESAWANIQSRSPLQIAEDEAIESMEIPSLPKRKTKRVYGPPGPETREKISRSLKDLEARTGALSKRLREINKDPVQYAKRIAAIKKARGTEEARKRTSEKLKEYFKSPENRLKRSQRMKGVPFTCTACGQEGHRKHFCPQMGYTKARKPRVRSDICSICGQPGHQSQTCSSKPVSSSPAIAPKGSVGEEGDKLDRSTGQKRPKIFRRCGVCQVAGHTRRNCPSSRAFQTVCSICSEPGHNKRTCPVAPGTLKDAVPTRAVGE